MTSDEFGDIEQLDENLRKWFKEKWVRFGPDGKIRGACARGDDSEGKPKCLPQKKAQNLGKKGRKYAASKKRREDPNPERRGKAKNVATKKKTNEEWSKKYKDSINCSNPKGFSQKAHCAGKKKNEDMHEETKKCPECGGPMYHESMMTEKQDACYHKVKSRYKVWPSAYASGALVQCRKKGAKNWGTGGKKNESNIMKGIVDEARAKQYVKPYISPQTGEQIGWKSSDGYHVKYWQMFAKDSAIKHAKLNPNEVDEAVDPKLGYDPNDYDDGYEEPPLQTATHVTIDDISMQRGGDLPAGTELKQHKRSKEPGPDQRARFWFFVVLDNGYPTRLVRLPKKLVKPVTMHEDYTGEFAAEKTPAINPYGGLKDRKHRGAISENPTDNPTGASGEGGWRRTDIEEEHLDELKCWTGYTRVKGVPAGAPGSCKKKTKESAILRGLKRENK
jgi:hypothetical protein